MMTILVAGAGKSSHYLIHYLITNAEKNNFEVIVADANPEAIKDNIGNSPFAVGVTLDITNDAEREPLVQRADIVLSLMPPTLHYLLAKDCLKYKKNLITSSYISPEIKEMEPAVREAGLMFMCEMGLDPGIDHMTAMQTIHGIQKVSGQITSFKSYCGGLVAPESDTNPWHYKFSWNPKNVVTAGLGGAKYLFRGKQVEIPYTETFNSSKKVKIEDFGKLAYYPNRDSYRYLDLYQVPEIKTFMRATLRHPQFMKGWDALVQLGLTDNEHKWEIRNDSYLTWFRQAVKCQENSSVVKHVAQLLQIDESDRVIKMMHWLGLFSEESVTTGDFTSAEILLTLLVEKWSMEPEDKDMVIMQHEFDYFLKTTKVTLTSTMVLIGESRKFSAMAKTVGLPIGILALLILKKKLVPPVGVCIPTMPSVYKPVLAELEHFGIVFKETVV
jgi:saccharopine dehydrogenase-like NADP-dependent oxidoreductase